MAAPTPTARGTPAGRKLKDGFRCLITIAGATTISFWEKTVQPPSCNGGDPIDQTTQHNVRWRTKAPRQLIDMGPVKTKVAYDPNLYSTILAIINVETTITVRFYDGSTVCFYGFLNMFEADDMSEGQQPEATVTIIPSNFDNTNNVEADPVVTSVAGT